MIAYGKIVVLTRSRRSKKAIEREGRSSRNIALVRSFRLLFVLGRCHAWVTLKRAQKKRIRHMVGGGHIRIKGELDKYKSNGKIKKSINNAVIYVNPPFRLFHKSGLKY